MSYQQYRAKVEELLANRRYSTTVEKEDEHMMEYAKLNVSRMSRLDKTIVLTEDSKMLLDQFEKDVTWLVISEGWCGDAAQIVPTLHALAEYGNINFRLIFRDEHLDVMDQFLTNGGRAIPKVLVVDNKTLEVVANWGPRPKEAQEVVNDAKRREAENPGSVSFEDMKYLIHKWYAQDKTLSTQKEALASLLV